MISPRVCFMVALTIVSIELKHSDATLVDLLNDVKNKLEKMQAGEEKLQNEIEDIQAGQKMMQKEMISLAKNGINMNGIKEEVKDVDETVKLVLHHVADETSDNNGTLSMVETVFVGGAPGASSEWSESFPKADAFKQNPESSGGGWMSENDKKDKPPVYIWYDFKRQLRPAKISYLPRNKNVASANVHRVKQFQFVGTDDPGCSKNSNWKVLCGGESAPYRSLDDERGCTVPVKQNMGAFHCLGLRSLVSADWKNDGVSLRGIRIWMYQ